MKQSLLLPMQILQSMIGGDFKFLYHDQPIKCILKDSHISPSILKEQRKDIQLFPKNNLQPVLQKIIYSFNSSMLFSIFGKIYYDYDNVEWTLEPIFITEVNEFFKIILDYYQFKQAKAFLKVFGIVFGMTIFSFFTIWSPLKAIINKIKNENRQKIQGNKIGQIKNYKNIKYIQVKPSSQLYCEKCKEKSVQIIYECGHLSICGACHQRNVTRQCPLCLKPSLKYFKIFMA